MDEGSFVIGDMPTFGLNMDLETELTSHDDILFYLTTGDQDATFDPHMTLGELASPPLVPTFSDPASFSSSPISSSSPASSPPFSFTSSPSDSGASPVSSPSSYTSSGQSSPASLDSDHFVFGSWIEAAVDPTSTIAPTQLQESVVVDHHIMPPLAILSPTDETVTSLATPSPKEESQEETKPSKKDTRKRKRTRKSSDEPPPQTAVTLPRDELLKLSSQELEDYAENLRKVRKLTPEEEKDLRRQRRLIKNRESAQLSRVRRREHVEELQQQLQEMQNENVRLQRQVESLTAENLQLKQHIAASSSSSSPSSSYSSTPQASPVPSAELSASAMEAGRMSADPPASPSLSKLLHSWTSLGKDATATAVRATYLFVILLSIGIFFNARFMHYGPGLGPMEVGPYRGLPHFYDAARPVIESGAASSQPVYIESLNDKPVGSSSHSVSTNSHRGARDWRRRDILQPDHELPLSTRSLDDKMDVVQSSTVEDASQGLSNPWKKETMFPLGVDRQATTMTTGEAANKTVLMCPSFHALQWPGPEASSATDEITFILPASSAAYLPALHQPSSSFVASARRTNGGSMVQLTCKVLDARMASLDSLLVS